MPVMWTDGGQSVYSHVITKFSGIGRFTYPWLLIVLRWRALRARERSAIMIIVSFIAFIQAIIIFDYSETPPYGELCNTVT